MAEQVRIDADRGGGTTRGYSGADIGDQERKDQPFQPEHAGPACAARRAAPRDQTTEGSITVETGPSLASAAGRPQAELVALPPELFRRFRVPSPTKPFGSQFVRFDALGRRSHLLRFQE